MIVAPYKRHPEPPTVCWLGPDARVTTEHGERVELETLPKGFRVWTDFDTVRELLTAGRGEALCWLGDEIRWRHRRLDRDGWATRPSDVAVLKLPFPSSVEACTAALSRWRDWLESYGASPTGTTGSAAWSLLRATLAEPLYTSAGWRGEPERLLRATLGGRQELGPSGAGVHTSTEAGGPLEHWDLPAAYASELGELPYGGQWQRVSELRRQGAEHELEWWARGNRPVFVRARVRVPAGLEYGPLPRRPRRKVQGLEAMLFATTYPRGVELRGMWTWQELEQARAVGCTVRELEAWVHLAGGARPFSEWWAAIQAGRSMGGLAGTLAKVTGNALWGRFCMDGGRAAARSIKSGARNGECETRRAPIPGGIPPAHDLAETVSGRVRAKLYAAMMTAGGRLVAAHTDGFWSHELGELSAFMLPTVGGWRLKEQARRLEVLSPQSLRYWPSPPAEWEPGIVLAGEPAGTAEEAFERHWAAWLERASDSRPWALHGARGVQA